MEIAVLVPCYNEGLTIKKVIEDFKKSLPEATIYVYDNNSNDDTSEVASKAGAVVCKEERQGKGYVVRRMFADIEADVYLMVDGDATYDAASAQKMIDTLIKNNLDMVVGTRVEQNIEAYRAGHKFGNWAFTTAVRILFGQSFSDILSGYRAFSKRFVKTFTANAKGFETETELTVHALDMELPTSEIETPYFERPEGSVSKLSTYKDGFRILKMIILLMKEKRPFLFFGYISTILGFMAIYLAYPLLMTYWKTGLVPRIPTAVLVTGLSTLSCLSLTAGVILDSVSRGKKEIKRLQYLGFSRASYAIEKGMKLKK